MIRFFQLLFIIPIFFHSVFTFAQTSVPVKDYSRDVAVQWMDAYTNIDRYTSGFRPCPGPRALAYIALSSYEACVKGMPTYNSIAGQMPGLVIPQIDPTKNYHWPTVINATNHYLITRFYSNASAAHLATIDQLKNTNNATFSAQVSAEVFQRSVAHGEAVAAAVWAYSMTDVLGHNSQLNAYGTYDWQAHVTGPSSYVMTTPATPQPVFAYYGDVRRFAISAADRLCAPMPIPYSEAPGSAFRIQAEEVVARSNSSQTTEDKWISEFWSDDFPGLMISPPNRFVSIANQAMKKVGSNLEVALYTYAKLGFSLNDAAVSCWYSKYYYNLIRPESYIKRVIDPSWEPTLNNPLTGATGVTPQFPSYPSGHSTFASAAAYVLTDIFGENFAMIDSTHIGRTEFMGAPRSFPSFVAMAVENSESRIPLGAHYRIDCDGGLVLGQTVANKVNGLPWKSTVNPVNCDAIAMTSSGNSITITNLTAPNMGIQIFNSSWQPMYSCTGGTCQKPTTTVPNLPAGNYFVKVTNYSANWAKVCEKSQYVSVSGGSGNSSVITFLPASDITVTANPGATSHPVTFGHPVATTTCPGGALTYQQLSGPSSGSAFPIGNTILNFQASDNCSNTKTASMKVTVVEGTGGAANCNLIGINTTGNSIVVSNLNSAITYVKVYNTAGAEVFKCVGNCTPGTVTIPNLPNGTYGVKARLMQSNSSIICEVFKTVVVNAGTITSPCDNLSITPEANAIKVSGLASTNNWGIQVFNAGWTKVFSCAGNTCTAPLTTIPNLVPGVYHVKINCYGANYALVCKKEQKVTISAPALVAEAAVNFSAEKQDKTVNLAWETLVPATKALDYFVVERSADNSSFDILQVVSDGISTEATQSFVAKDLQPLEESNFYRLRVVFTDGTELVSAFQFVSFHTQAGLLVFPNPTSGEFAIAMDNFAGEATTIAIYNLLGQEVLRQDAADTAGLPLVISNHRLGEGVYQIAITSAKGVRAIGRVVVSEK